MAEFKLNYSTLLNIGYHNMHKQGYRYATIYRLGQKWVVFIFLIPLMYLFQYFVKIYFGFSRK